MKNPEVVYEKTPNGGDYSELYMIDKNGNLAKKEEEAFAFRILEKTKDGIIVKETLGIK